MPAATTALHDPTRANRAIAVWLFCCCAMIAGAVVLGGVTRLTHAGLSMVDWAPLSGWLPPRTEAAWQAAFDLYQQYPEFRKLKPDMTLAGFKARFWLEYTHRLWGRCIGLVFLVPFLVLLARRQIPAGLLPRLLAMFALGGVQGVLGWYMVLSGLVDRPDVSQYRLTAHLGLAFAIHAYVFCVALDLRVRRGATGEGRPATYGSGMRVAVAGLAVLVYVTVLSGGFVAGTDAGFAYNTFPLMAGRWVPDHLFALEPPLRNLFENVATVQFQHRVLAVVTLGAVLALWATARRRSGAARPAPLAFHALAATAVLQVTLGISTLLAGVPVALAALHQAGAFVLFTAVLWVWHTVARP